MLQTQQIVALKTFKTPNGTELPLRMIHNQEYLDVKYRIVWFREMHPNWSIETEVKPGNKCCLGRAVIKDDSGRIMAMAHKFEDAKDFHDYIEKSETSAIGRALALCGFGTQFVGDELNEGERIVDSTVQRISSTSIPPIPHPAPKRQISAAPQEFTKSGLHCVACHSQMNLTKKGDAYNCPNWKDRSVKHSYYSLEQAGTLLSHSVEQSVEKAFEQASTQLNMEEGDIPF